MASHSTKGAPAADVYPQKILEYMEGFLISKVKFSWYLSVLFVYHMISLAKSSLFNPLMPDVANMQQTNSALK